MAKSIKHPQFFKTLLPGFHTHFAIPKDFFLKYIQGGRTVTKLKSDVSEKTWKVKLSGLKFTDGWEEFVVANDFQTGDVVVVKYIGEDNLFHVSDLGPDYSQKLPNSEESAETFVARVTSSNLRTDTLEVPIQFTISTGLSRKCRKIVLTDGGDRSWSLDLMFNESSATFYISQGWKNFCDENGQEAGGFILFKLVRNGEIPVLSFCSKESVYDRRQKDCSEASRRESVATKHSSEEENIAAGDGSEDECSSLMDIEKIKPSPKRRRLSYSSYLPCDKRITFTFPTDYTRIDRLNLSAPFVREHGINKPGKIFLLDKYGRKWLTTLSLDRGRVYLGKGWKDFVKTNGLETGFTLKMLWEETTPVLSLCCAESNSDRDTSNRDEIDNNENNKEETRSWERKKNNMRDSTPSSQEQFVTLTITPSSLKHTRLCLPKSFTRENDINKPGIITLLGKDRKKYQTSWLLDKRDGRMGLGSGLKLFVKDNGLKTGDSFTLKLIWQDQTPVLSLCPAGEAHSNQKKSLPIEPSIRKDKNINEEHTKEESRSTDSATNINEEHTKEERRSADRASPSSQKQLSLCSAESNSDRDTSNRDMINNNENNKEETRSMERKKNNLRDSTPSRKRLRDGLHTQGESGDMRGNNYGAPSSQEQYVTLTITPNSVKHKRLHLPKSFTKENGINKPGIINLLGKDRIKYQTSLLLETDGRMALGSGWKLFWKDNGLKTGDSFTFKLIWEDQTPLLSLCPAGEARSNEKKSLPIEPSTKYKNINEEHTKEESRSLEREKNNLRDSTPSRKQLRDGLHTQDDMGGNNSSAPSSQEQYVTLTITPYSVKHKRLRLPIGFTRENGINKLGIITLLGKDRKKYQTSLLLDKTYGQMSLGSGWHPFVKDNGLKTGDSFTLKLIWEDQTPVLSLCHAREAHSNQKNSLPIEPNINKDKNMNQEHTKEEKKSFPIEPSISKDKNINEEFTKEESMSLERKKHNRRDSTPSRKRLTDWPHTRDDMGGNNFSAPSSQEQYETLTITPSSVKRKRLRLTKSFTRENGINKPGIITLLGKDRIKYQTSLLIDKTDGRMSLGNGWATFVKDNGLKTGDSFTLKLIWEDQTPVLSLCLAREAHSNEKKSLSIEPSTSKDIYINEEHAKVESRSADKASSSSQKQLVTLKITPSSVTHDRLILAAQFAKENGINKHGTIYLLDTDGTKRLIKLKRDKNGTMSLGNGWKEFAETNDLKLGESFTMELIWEDTTPVLSLLRSCSKSVTLLLTPEDVKACKLILPRQFMEANGIDRLGKVTVLSESKMEWSGYLLSRDGTVALGNGWEGFCEANGVKLGQSFTLEFVYKQDTTPVLKFCSLESR